MARLGRKYAAMLLMTASAVGGVTMSACVREVSSELHPVVITFWRQFLGTILLLPWLTWYGSEFLATRRFGMHAVRSIITVSSMVCAFMSVSMIPLAQHTAISFLSPAFATLFAILFLGEKAKLSRCLALAVGFIGMVIILRPGASFIGAGVFFTIASALIWGVGLAVIRALGKTESAFTTTLWSSVLMSVFALPLALWQWNWPSATGWMWLGAIAVIGSLGQLALSQALVMAEAGAVAPTDFLKLVWAAILGYLAFGQVPDAWAWTGGTIVVCSGMILVFGERASPRIPAAEKRE